ncbi:MAG: DUF2336 domain-containing protein [Roseibium sp.]|uniref:DUF2336 domain-containing protein n=1 Tax=Roseibium sp. TaxID=1936156 RepID=UPI0026266990|nr:DUF2336 domain-containing protein [Roseibium sp.]MCV0427424.1 DUF2336 domain-containing protein [Roseibium sp.]
MLLSATELYAGRPRHDVEDKKIFLELAQNLLPSTPVSDRRRIANLLASHPEMPDDFLENLATDDDHLTAYPALRYSPRLPVDLLVSTAVSGPDTLRKAVANRPSLRESVISALCEHAGADVVRILLDRNDILLTSTQQAKLSRRSDIVAALGLELAGQDALNPDGLMGQFLHLPPQLKNKAVAAAELTSLVKQAQVPAGQQAKYTDTAHLRLQDAIYNEALNQNRIRFSDLLGRGLGLSQATCDMMLQEDQAEGLTVALKALGFGLRHTTTVLVRLLGTRVSLQEIRAVLRLYRTLSTGAAEVLVGQWILQDQQTLAKTPQHQPQYQEVRQQKETATDLSKKSAANALKDASL